MNYLAPYFTKVNCYYNKFSTLKERGFMSNGWIKLHRKFNNWEWRDSPKHVAVYLDLLLNANHKEKKYRGKIIKRGQLTTSYKAISDRTGVSIRSIRTVLRDLKSTHEVTHENMRHYSIITISKWDDYQLVDTRDDILTTSKRQPSDNLTTTNKNDNNYNNVNKCVLLTPDEVRISWNKFAIKNGFNQCAGIGSGKHLNNFLEAINFLPTLSDWEDLFNRCAKSNFLNGGAPSGWKVSFIWLCDYDNALKVLNGEFESTTNNVLDWQEPGDF